MNELTRIFQDTQKTVGEVMSAAIPPARGSFEESLSTVARQLEQLRLVTQKQVEAVGENTQAISQNTLAQARSGASVAGEVAKTASSWLGGGGSFMPLLSSLIGLFRGGKPESPPSLATYVRPAALHAQAAAPKSSGERLSAVDYDQHGLPRKIQPADLAATPQVTVQVQAIDSRSFLDHSDEIARAVREALLNAHSLNDVVNEW